MLQLQLLNVRKKKIDVIKMDIPASNGDRDGRRLPRKLPGESHEGTSLGGGERRVGRWRGRVVRVSGIWERLRQGPLPIFRKLSDLEPRGTGFKYHSRETDFPLSNAPGQNQTHSRV